MSSLDPASSFLASAARLGAGGSARPARRRPERLLEIYEFEACPFCRRVREALSEFDLDALILPCPRGGTRFRPKARELDRKSTRLNSSHSKTSSCVVWLRQR